MRRDQASIARRVAARHVAADSGILLHTAQIVQQLFLGKDFPRRFMTEAHRLADETTWYLIDKKRATLEHLRPDPEGSVGTYKVPVSFHADRLVTAILNNLGEELGSSFAPQLAANPEVGKGIAVFLAEKINQDRSLREIRAWKETGIANIKEVVSVWADVNLSGRGPTLGGTVEVSLLTG